MTRPFAARLARDTKGAVAVVVALALPLVVGMMTLAVEVGVWYAERRSLQVAADAAALSGAFELAAGHASTIVQSAVTDARKNGLVAGDGATLAVRTPPTSGKYAGDTRAVEVAVTRQQALLFAGLFMKNAEVGARAVARAGAPGDYCVLALETVDSDAAEFSGNADIDLSNCGVMANSSSPQALTVSGSSTLAAKFIETVGGYGVSGAGTLAVDAAITGSSAAEDPYGDLKPPADQPCDHTNFRANDSRELEPGVYCGGLDLGAQADVSLKPGTYVVKGGSVNINGGAAVTGTGVTLMLTGSGSDFATMTINGGATIALTAPTAGEYAGLVVFQDPRAPEGAVNKLNGGSTTDFTGVLYFPRQQVQFTGGNRGANGCTRIVANSVSFSGNAKLGNKCDGTGVPGGGARRPYLVE